LPLGRLNNCARAQPFTLLTNIVRASTSVLRCVSIARRSLASGDGLCTLGSLSMRQLAIERFCASRLSVFTPRWPTPRLGASVAGTMFTSCPAELAWSATVNASEHVSRTMRLFSHCLKTSLNLLVSTFASDNT